MTTQPSKVLPSRMTLATQVHSLPCGPAIRSTRVSWPCVARAEAGTSAARMVPTESVSTAIVSVDNPLCAATFPR